MVKIVDRLLKLSSVCVCVCVVIVVFLGLNIRSEKISNSTQKRKNIYVFTVRRNNFIGP